MSWVSYLGLESHRSHTLAKKLLRPNAFGGMLNFRVKGDMKQACSVIDHLRLASNLANAGTSIRWLSPCCSFDLEMSLFFCHPGDGM